MKLTPSNSLSDLLHIELNGNYDSVVMQTTYVGTEDSSTIVNSPLSSGSFYAIRQVYRVPNQFGGYHFLVNLLEFYPCQGRMWFRMYDINQKKWLPVNGWNCISPVSGWQ